MTRAQRLTFLGVAVAILIAAVLIIGLGGDDPDAERTSQSTATATATPPATETPDDGGADATPTPETTPKPTPDPGPLLVSGKVTRIEVKKGERVRFRARSSTPEEVHVHGYDVSKDLEPGKTVEMSFVADIEGIFEIELEHSAEQIGELRVEP